MIDREKIWPKKITVDKRVVEILSGSTYENFPKALKEIITNSYDADAENVKVDIDVQNEVITITDDGVGMDEEDFDFYFRIAGRTRHKSDRTQKERLRIGKFGVGFLSVFPFVNNYYIESKRKGNNSEIFANIQCSQYFTSKSELRDVNEIPIQGGRRSSGSASFKQYTMITLTGFTKVSRAFFNEEYHLRGRRKTILSYDAMHRLSWELSEDLPILYQNEALNRLIHSNPELKFNLFLNGEQLFRNQFADHVLDKHEGEMETIGKIKFKYFISTNYATISPVEGRYLKMRNLDVGVGPRTTFGIGLEGRLYARLAHLTGEVNVISGLNDFIKVSRDSFNFSRDFEDFKDFFRQKLRYWSEELDKLHELDKLAKERGENQKVDGIESLDNSIIESRVRSLEKKGFKVTTSQPKDKETDDSDIRGDKESTDKIDITIDRENREIYLPESVNYKVLFISGREYRVISDEWDLSDSCYPAVKIDGDYLQVNKRYPLFHDKKYFDVFLKLHAMLTQLHKQNVVSDEIHNVINSELLEVFKQYKK